jgi:hypothetical protein
MLDECRQCVVFFLFSVLSNLLKLVIFLIFSQIGGYSNNGTKYLIFNIFHILGKCHKKIVIFFIFGLFSLNSKFATKVFFFQNMFHKMVKVGPSKNHLVQVTELFNIFQKIGVFLRFLL